MPKTIKRNGVTIVDYSADVSSALKSRLLRAGQAVGIEAVGWVVNKMQSGYYRRIWRTGDLQRDVNSTAEVEGNNVTVRIGNSLRYALFVHEGTRKMKSRPYLKDGVSENEDRIGQVFAEYLKG